MIKITYIIYYGKYFLKIILIEPILTIKELWYCFFKGRFLGKKIDLKIEIGKNNFIIPNNHHAFYTLHEVFTWGLYKKLKGCNYVLDLGGFLGDTGVYFSLYNNKVDIYEPSVTNFGYIIKNIVKNNNISTYNLAVTASYKEVYYSGGPINAGGKIDVNGTEKVDNIHIKDIIDNGYDALKMDIEGGEYEILNYLLETNKFPFNKGYIEFHYYNGNENIQIINNLLKYLNNEKYNCFFEDVYGKSIFFSDIYNLDPNIFVLYFEKQK